ncbi:19830_t:CDS:2 [Entrophospora sp. SA101]|nr:19830_t:CDS:2 [Entrophospora sp. SA101]
MDLHNLATVITPNILYSKSKDPSKDESFLAIEAVHNLLKYQDEFWVVPDDLMAILEVQDLFSNPEVLTTKDILKRCEDFVKSKKMQNPISEVGENKVSGGSGYNSFNGNNTTNNGSVGQKYEIVRHQHQNAPQQRDYAEPYHSPNLVKENPIQIRQ